MYKAILPSRYRPENHWAPTIVCFLLLSASIFSTSLVAVVDVHGASPGLIPGQFAHYALSGNETGGAVDALFTVLRINGANVTFSDLDTFQDGHTTTETINVSISTGPLIPASGEYFVISPAKQVGESVYPGDYHYQSLTIQDITTRPYGSASRPMAHVHALNSSQVATTFEDFYWDHSTGLFTEIVKSQNSVTVLRAVMSTTNLWQPDLPPDPLFIPTAVVSLFSASIIGVLLVGRYRKRAKLTR